MEMAVCSSLTAFSFTKPPQFSLLLASKHSSLKFFTVLKKPLKTLAVSMHMETNSFGFPSKGGAGILERPNFELPQFDPTPQPQEGGDMGWLKYKRGVGYGDSYRVLLIDDKRHTEKLVASVLPKVVPVVTTDDARNLFQESQLNGVAVVIVAVKEHAEFYVEMMTHGGLCAAIEPDSDTM
ncbi:Adaptor protein ClpS [Macleaya cordata]|uniref:Adaptor protein ClpS n=1 Tax=Macleaya cordata TaxID=56857 RepID=A0A200PSG0_MACCD|nr:Adaptor protein ClpS [Macleaya cordata]